MRTLTQLLSCLHRKLIQLLLLCCSLGAVLLGRATLEARDLYALRIAGEVVEEVLVALGYPPL
jgi:hypothetical protein